MIYFKNEIIHNIFAKIAVSYWPLAVVQNSNRLSANRYKRITKSIYKWPPKQTY